ncbi:MAG: TrkA family potassium uptake protein [Chloroflexi bacterium]|nr:TrkA family potassium uptake protein [Chloroflexota bacterium]
MRVVIVGCGRVGALLATLLAQDGHQVAIVDRNPAAFRRLPPTFAGRAVEGDAFDLEILRQAGIERTDAFATVTAGDNTNYVLAAMARRRFRVPQVVARIYDPVRADIYRRLGVPTISSTTWGANKIRDLILHLGLTSVLTVANAEVEVVEVEVSAPLAGHEVLHLNVPEEVQVVAIVRAGRAFIPSPLATLETGDLLYVAVAAAAKERLESMLMLR